MTEGSLWHWQDDGHEASISVSDGHVAVTFSQGDEAVLLQLDPERATAIANALREAARRAALRD